MKDVSHCVSCGVLCVPWCYLKFELMEDLMKI